LLEIRISIDGDVVRTKSLFLSYSPVVKKSYNTLFSLGNSAEKNSELMASLKETGKYEITADMKAQLSDFYCKNEISVSVILTRCKEIV